MDELLKKKSRRIVTGTVRSGRRTEIITVGKQGKYIRYRTPKSGEMSDLALLPTITSAIMHSKGGKVHVKKTDYKDLLRSSNLKAELRQLMDKQHRTVIKALLAGRFDEIVYGRPAEAPAPKPKGY